MLYRERVEQTGEPRISAKYAECPRALMNNGQTQSLVRFQIGTNVNPKKVRKGAATFTGLPGPKWRVQARHPTP